MKYWSGENYLGLGPSAHSYNGYQRHWNPASVSQYQKYYEKGLGQIGEESISDEMHRNELLMTRLRTIWGIHRADWEQQIKTQSWQAFLDQCQTLFETGRLLIQHERITIPRSKFFEADGIISELFEV